MIASGLRLRLSGTAAGAGGRALEERPPEMEMRRRRERARARRRRRERVLRRRRRRETKCALLSISLCRRAERRRRCVWLRVTDALNACVMRSDRSTTGGRCGRARNMLASSSASPLLLLIIVVVVITPQRSQARAPLSIRVGECKKGARTLPDSTHFGASCSPWSGPFQKDIIKLSHVLSPWSCPVIISEI